MSDRGSDDRLLTEEQVAELLQVHVQTVRGWRRKGTGPKVVWAGRYPRYWHSDVRRWLEQGKPQSQ